MDKISTEAYVGIVLLARSSCSTHYFLTNMLFRHTRHLSKNNHNIQTSEIRMIEDFLVTVSDGNGGEQTILIWIPLAATAYKVVLEYGGSQYVAGKASDAVRHFGRNIDYEQNLTVRRQVIMSARKAADAVIEELGNGDVAAAVLEAVREGGEILASAKASGIVIDASLTTQKQETEPTDCENDRVSSTLINIALSKPMGIVFEPIGDDECGVRIRDIPRGGKAYLLEQLQAGDEVLSINDTGMSNLKFYEIMEFISEQDDQKHFNLVFLRRNKKEMKAAMGRRFKNLVKRRSSSNNIKMAEQRNDRDGSGGSLYTAMQLFFCGDLYGRSKSVDYEDGRE